MTTPEASIATSILTSPVPSARGYFDAVASNDLGDTSVSDVARIIVEQADVVTLFAGTSLRWGQECRPARCHPGCC